MPGTSLVLVSGKFHTFFFKSLNCRDVQKTIMRAPFLAGAYNPRRDIWDGMERSVKTGQGKKSLISTFACLLTAIARV